jgi:hypothetical protein
MKTGFKVVGKLLLNAARSAGGSCERGRRQRGRGARGAGFRSVVFLLAIGPGLASANPGSRITCPPALAGEIPPRPATAPLGTRFAARVAEEDSREREAAIKHEILRGNVPAFLRSLKPVRLRAKLAAGRTVTATICVMPDYLAIGTNRDFLRIPMNLHTATDVAAHFGFVLPTRKMVDAIYRQSAAHLRPQPMPAGREMCSVAYYVRHNAAIREQRLSLGIPLGVLISGQKKDVVISNRLASHPGRIAIYGWQNPDGTPIQPLSTLHGANYGDYSHGIRLVSDVMYLNGEPASVHHVLEDPELAALLSDEGPVEILSRLIPARPARLAQLESSLSGSSQRSVVATHSRPAHSPTL